MKRTLLIFLILALAAVQPAHAAGTGQATASSSTLTYTVEDVSFDGPDCAQVKWTANYTKPAATSLRVETEIEQDSSNSRIDYDVLSVRDASTSGLLTGLLCVPLSADVTLGGFHLTAKLSAMDDIRTTTNAVGQPAPFTVSQNPSSIPKFKAYTAINMTWITGRAMAQAPGKGTIGATGWVYIQRLGPTGWRTIGRDWTTNYGEFQETLTDELPAGTKIRATLRECRWCTNARATTRVKQR